MATMYGKSIPMKNGSAITYKRSLRAHEDALWTKEAMEEMSESDLENLEYLHSQNAYWDDIESRSGEPDDVDYVPNASYRLRGPLDPYVPSSVPVDVPEEIIRKISS